MAWIMCPHCKQRIDYQWSMGTPTACPHCTNYCGPAQLPEGSGSAIGYILLIIAAYFVGTWIWEWFTGLEWYWQALIGFVAAAGIMAPIASHFEDEMRG